jgi:hypothetical protein
MIGRTEKVSNFDLHAWARRMGHVEHELVIPHRPADPKRRRPEREESREHRRLRPLELLVLQTLCSYAKDELAKNGYYAATAWPSLKRLAKDCGCTATSDGRCSAVSDALLNLEYAGLIWSKQRGHKTALRELLYTSPPSVTTEGESATIAPDPVALLPSARKDVLPSGRNQ